MQTKYCHTCGAQNYINAQFCHGCGAQTTPIQPTPVIEKQPKKQGGNTLLIICGIAVFGCAGLTAIGSFMRSDKKIGSTSFATPTPSATPDLPTHETQPSPTTTKGAPEYSQALVAAEKLGFELVGHTNPDLTFIAEGESHIDGQRYTLVVMGQGGNRVDTIRIQAWGPQTKQVRQRLEEWATETLSSLNRGKLPPDFIRKLYAGVNVGDDGISNGFCNVQVLQKPITPGRPNENDRITIDLIFDKTD